MDCSNDSVFISIFFEFPMFTCYLPRASCAIVGYYACCLWVCLFATHLIRNCCTDSAEILHCEDGGLAQTLNLEFLWRSLRGPARGAENVVFLGRHSLVVDSALWQLVFHICSPGGSVIALIPRGDIMSVLHWPTCFLFPAIADK